MGPTSEVCRGKFVFSLVRHFEVEPTDRGIALVILILERIENPVTFCEGCLEEELLRQIRSSRVLERGSFSRYQVGLDKGSRKGFVYGYDLCVQAFGYPLATKLSGICQLRQNITYYNIFSLESQ